MEIGPFVPEILKQWEAEVRASQPRGDTHDDPVLTETAPAFLAELARALSSASGRLSDDLPVPVDPLLVQALHEYHLLRRVIIEVLEAHGPLPASDRRVIHDAIDSVIETVGEQIAGSREQKQSDRDELYRLLIDSARDFAILTMDLQNRILTWNVGAEQITGFAAAEVIGRSGAILFTPEDRARGAVERELQTALTQGRAEDERWHLRKDGSRFFASGVMIPLGDAEPRGFAKVMRDVTERKQLEAALELRAAELTAADQRKDQFLAMLAHELRNPLAPVRNAVELLKRRGAAEPSLRRPLEIIEHQVELQVRLLDDLLNVNRIGRGTISLRHELLDLVQLVRRTADDHRHVLEAAGLAFTMDLPDSPVWVEGDPARLTQVINNVVQNAVKFTDRGGEVRLSLARTADGRQVQVRVADTGIGIGAELLPRIFDTFMQADRSLDRRRGGLGLGLAMVKGLVELHGGTVQAYSEGLGKGTQLTITLPTAEAAAAPSEVSPAARPAGRLLRILVVEDNIDAADTMRELLVLFGHDVEVAYSGGAGVEAARRFRPEAVLCDIGLPGMDGYAVAAALRQDPVTAAARLIAVSGYGQEEDRVRAREAGFDAHLIKPVDPEELQRLLDGPNLNS